MKKINITLIILLLVLPFYSRYKFAGSVFFKAWNIENFTEQKFDYVIIGGSQSLVGLNTEQINNQLNITGYNASLDGEGIVGSLTMLQHLLESNVQFDILILSLQAGFEGDTNDIKVYKNSYRWFPYLFRDYVSSQFGINNWIDKCVQTFFIFYKSNKTIMPALASSFLRPNYQWKYDRNGDYIYPENKNSGLSMELIGNNKTVDIDTHGIVKSIYQICDSAGISVLLHVAPLYDRNYYLESSTQATMINQSSLLRESYYFYDNIHVNALGRRAATEDFISRFDLILNRSKTGGFP